MDEGVRATLARAQDELRSACPGVKWVAPELLHLTVKFLGEVPDQRVKEVCDATMSVAAAAAALDVTVGGGGCFPPRGKVRVIWAGVDEPSGQLLKFVEGVEAALEPLGFPRESRPFSAHITLGRVREDRSGGGVRRAVESCSIEPMPLRVEELVWMQSVLSPRGPSYTPIARAPLAN